MKRFTLILLCLTFFATLFAGKSQLMMAANVLNENVATPQKAIPDRSAKTAEGANMAEAGMMERCREMMDQKQKMKEDMAAQDAQLTEQLSEMNQAPADKKTDLMAALLTNMVEKRIAMDARKAKMEEEMMQHMMQHMRMSKTSMSHCPMMKGMSEMKVMDGMKGMDDKPAATHKEHQEEQK